MSLWVTRERPKVDRVATVAVPWLVTLVTRFVDAKARLLVQDHVHQRARERGRGDGRRGGRASRATPFDVDGHGVEISHVGPAVLLRLRRRHGHVQAGRGHRARVRWRLGFSRCLAVSLGLWYS